MSEQDSSGYNPGRDQLTALAEKFRSIVDIADRKYGFPSKKFEKCFVGEEAVTQLMHEGIAADEDDAVRVGNLMLEAGFFHHVQRAHEFKNEYLFYRFAEDEDHGSVKESVSSDGGPRWVDFLGTFSSANEAISLQPSWQDIHPLPDVRESRNQDNINVSPLDEYNATLLDNVHPKSWSDPEPKKMYNLVVIGAGAGGLVSAAGAAGVGAQTALIESHLLGGDCLNIGCVPSKALLRCAKAAAAVRRAETYGVRIEGEVSVDFGYVMERMRRLRSEISPADSAHRFSTKLGVDVFMGRAKFTGSNSVEVNGKTLMFRKAVVATGGKAAVPDIPGLQDVEYLTNSSVFNLTELPGRIGVVGAGPIGMELAQAFQRFGSQVTVFTIDDKILPREDPEAAALVKKSLGEDGVQFVYNSVFERIERLGESPMAARVVLGENMGSHDFDAILVATGRKPAVQGLGLEEAGVEYDNRKGVSVNEQLQSTNPDIYAVGDVASKYQFTHMADFMARIVIKNALFFGRDKVSDLLIPWCTYTEPEVAHVGLYEKDLGQREIPFITYTREFSDVDRAIVDGEEKGFVKVHIAKGKDTILGATIVGSHAGDMISEISVAMHGKLGLGKLAGVIHPYPTTAEAIRQCGDAYNRERLTPMIKSIFYKLMELRR